MYVRSLDHLRSILLLLLLDDSNQRMPLSVQRSVRKQNIKFLHNRILFSQECFTFIKRLVQSNVQQLNNLLLQQQQQQQQRIEDQVLFTNVKFLPANSSEKFIIVVDRGRTGLDLRSNRNEISLFNRMANEETSSVCIAY